METNLEKEDTVEDLLDKNNPWLVLKGKDVEMLGPYYAEIKGVRMQLRIYGNVANIMNMTPSFQAKFCNSMTYFTEQKDVFSKIGNTIRFRYAVKNGKKNSNRSTNDQGITTVYIDVDNEHIFLVLTPLLRFMKLGYAVTVDNCGTGTDGIAYISEAVRKIQEEFHISGFFIEELSLIRNFRHEFFESEHICIQREDKIVVIEAEPSAGRVTGSEHGILQVEPVIKKGLANNGYVSYGDKNSITQQVYENQFDNKEMIGTIGLINLQTNDKIESNKSVPLRDERVLHELDHLLKYYLCCNFTLSELMEMSGARNDVEQINTYISMTKIEEIIMRLKKVMNIQ